MNACFDRWPVETRQKGRYASYNAKIEDGIAKGLKPSGQFAALQSFLRFGLSEDAKKKTERLVERVKESYNERKVGEKNKYFTYLLLDKEILSPPHPPTFQRFLRSILYIGKGYDQRPRQHGIDALAVPEADLPFQSRKIQVLRRLLDTHKSMGIIRTNRHSLSKVALAFEHAMIKAVGLAGLTNAKPEQMPKLHKEKAEDEDYEEEGEETEVDQPLWSEAEVESIGVDRLLDAWDTPVLEVHLTTFLNNAPLEWNEEDDDRKEDDKEKGEDEEEEEEVVEKVQKGPEERKKERLARLQQRSARKEQERAKKERKRRSKELKQSGLIAAQQEERRKRSEPTRQPAIGGNKRKKN